MNRKKQKEKQQITEQERMEELLFGKKKKNIFTVRKAAMCVGWLLIAGSIIYGIYNNVTAVDTHTIERIEVVDTKVDNTAGIVEFVKNFAKDYYTLASDTEFKNDRNLVLSQYMSDELVNLNSIMLNGVKEPVVVSDIEVWDIEEIANEKDSVQEQEGEESLAGGKDYEVLFTVKQNVKDIIVEGAYSMEVHKDNQGIIITKNPVIASMPIRSDYVREKLASDGLVSAKEQERVKIFLNTFFAIYPKAAEEELVYYVKDKNVKAVGKAYELTDVKDIVICESETGYQVSCCVYYYDTVTGATLVNEYELVLTEREEELVILSMR